MMIELACSIAIAFSCMGLGFYLIKCDIERQLISPPNSHYGQNQVNSYDDNSTSRYIDDLIVNNVHQGFYDSHHSH